MSESITEQPTQETKTNTVSEEKIKVTIETEIPEQFNPALNKIQKRVENLSRASERGIINEVSGASLVTRDNGQVNIVSNEYVQYKLNPNGQIFEQSLESVTVSNRKKFTVDEIVINEHKLNPHIYELTDFKQVLQNTDSAVGNFCITGTVLVKCWESNLKRYVFIRRQVRIPMFSPMLNLPEIPEALNIGEPLQEPQDLQVVMASGYQVNGEITDSKSNIGKDTTHTETENTKKVEQIKNKAANIAKE